jgi:hypothetical protein
MHFDPYFILNPLYSLQRRFKATAQNSNLELGKAAASVKGTPPLKPFMA